MVERNEIDKIEWSQNENGLIMSKNYYIIPSDENSVSNSPYKPKDKQLNDKIKWIVNNLTPILLMPSLLGAVWQIIELSKIHISYIRFFSVS